MNSVSLVSTFHEERGLANVSALLAILEGIRPEVIFLELPVAAFHDFFVICSRANLESTVVRKYRESYQVKLVLVDLPAPGEGFLSRMPYLFKRIEEVSHEYRRLVDLNRAYVTQYGFAYLNSEYSSKLWSDIYEEMLRTIREIDDPGLVELYELWSTAHDSREDEMMKNILSYCMENKFDKSVFLVGAAHRQGIIRRSRGQPGIEWSFPNCNENAPSGTSA